MTPAMARSASTNWQLTMQFLQCCDQVRYVAWVPLDGCLQHVVDAFAPVVSPVGTSCIDVIPQEVNDPVRQRADTLRHHLLRAMPTTKYVTK